MSERNISINTYDKLDNIFKVVGKVFIPENNLTIEVPGNQVLNLFNYFLEDGSRLKLREENEKIIFKFTLSFEDGYSSKDLGFLVNEDENPFNVLAIRIQASCKKSRCVVSRKAYHWQT